MKHIWTKRTFLLTLSYLSVADIVTALPQDGTCKKTTVAILGAGVAGITAGQVLANSSVNDFLIIEANDYVGGRVKHVEFGRDNEGQPYVVELGANWVQGVGSDGGPENPIWYLAQKYGLNSTNDEENGLNTLAFDKDGPWNLTDLQDQWDTAYAAAGVNAGERMLENLPDTTLRAGLDSAGWRWDSVDTLAKTIEYLNWDLAQLFSPEESGLIAGICSENSTYNQFGPDDWYVWDQRGFNTFVEGMAGEYLEANDPRLMLNTTVTKISYSDTGVTVELEDGCIEAEHVIVTFSIGVLQSNHVSFDPPLPPWKRDAIDRFQMGTFLKIFYQFPTNFWGEDVGEMIWSDPETAGWWPEWKALSAPGYLEGSNITFSVLVGDLATRAELRGLNQTKADGLAVLRRMFGEENVPEPTDFLFYNWGRDPSALGTYSNWPVGMTLEMHQNMRANIDRLWFSGEAMSAQYYGYLQGAYFEGQDAGTRVVQVLNGSANGTAGNGTVGNMKFYPDLRGQTPYSQYAHENGWSTGSNFADFGLSVQD